MTRGLLLFIAGIVIFYALRSLFRSAVHAYHEDGGRQRVKGEDMVLDPQCRTYVVKDRALTKRIGGSVHSFCSEECARRYEASHRR